MGFQPIVGGLRLELRLELRVRNPFAVDWTTSKCGDAPALRVPARGLAC
jgi:hypothetical protein